jgi:thiol-disulfide isomerase/thioredoxin
MILPTLFLIVFFMTDALAQDTIILKGIGERENLWKKPYSEWSGPGYDHYQPDEKIIKKCEKKMDDSLRIIIFMGTWCSDSRKQVPHFYKILDLLQFPMYNIKLIFVDRDKNDGIGEAKKWNVKKVPTFIITDKYGGEIGRIVESPKRTLEKDLLAILKKI